MPAKPTKRDALCALFMTPMLALAACANDTMSPQGVNAQSMGQDVERCQAELPQAESSYEEAFVSRGLGVALERTRADPAAYAMYRANLVRLCLQARGHVHLNIEQLQAIQSHVPLPPGEAPK